MTPNQPRKQNRPASPPQSLIERRVAGNQNGNAPMAATRPISPSPGVTPAVAVKPGRRPTVAAISARQAMFGPGLSAMARAVAAKARLSPAMPRSLEGNVGAAHDATNANKPR